MFSFSFFGGSRVRRISMCQRHYRAIVDIHTACKEPNWFLEMPIVRAATDCRIHLRMTTIVGVQTWPVLSRALMRRVLSVKIEVGWRSSGTAAFPRIYIDRTNLENSSRETSFFGLDRFHRINGERYDIVVAFLFRGNRCLARRITGYNNE